MIRTDNSKVIAQLEEQLKAAESELARTREALEKADLLAKATNALVGCGVWAFCGKCKRDHLADVMQELAAYEKIRNLK